MPVLNYIGVSLTLVSILTFMFVKTEETHIMNSHYMQNPNFIERKPLLDTGSHIHTDFLSINSAVHNTSFEQEIVTKSRLERCMDKLSEKNKKICGIILSIFCGIMSGVSYLPIMYIQNQYSNASLDYNDYYYSFVCGVLIMSLFIFFLYCIFERNKPAVSQQVVIPGLLVGK